MISHSTCPLGLISCAVHTVNPHLQLSIRLNAPGNQNTEARVKPASSSTLIATSQRVMMMVQVRRTVDSPSARTAWTGATLTDYPPAKVVRVPPSIHRTEAGTPRARAPKACNECHAHKTRCTSEHPQCRRCKSLNIECVYEKSKRKSASASGSRSTATPNRAVPSSQPVDIPPEQPLKVEQSIEPDQVASPSVSLSPTTDRNRGLSLGQNLLVEYAAQVPV